jgi:hypothetical protein
MFRGRSVTPRRAWRASQDTGLDLVIDNPPKSSRGRPVRSRSPADLRMGCAQRSAPYGLIPRLLLPGFSVDEHAVACRGHLVAHAARLRDPLDSTQPTSGVFVPPGRAHGLGSTQGMGSAELRHSFVSLLSRSGMTIEEIAHLVGYASTSVAERVYRKDCVLSSHAGRVPSTSSSRGRQAIGRQLRPTGSTDPSAKARARS